MGWALLRSLHNKLLYTKEGLVSFEITSTVAVISGIAAGFSAIHGFRTAYYAKPSNKNQTLEDRIDKLTDALKESSHLVSEVENEINARKNLVQELQEDAEKYQKLISMNKEQVEAVAQLLQGELQKEGKKSFWKGVLANFIFFVLGASISIVLSIGI